MSLIEFGQNLIGSSADPFIIEIFACGSALIVVKTFMAGFLGAIFNFFRK